MITNAFAKESDRAAVRIQTLRSATRGLGRRDSCGRENAVTCCMGVRGSIFLRSTEKSIRLRPTRLQDRSARTDSRGEQSHARVSRVDAKIKGPVVNHTQTGKAKEARKSETSFWRGERRLIASLPAAPHHARKRVGVCWSMLVILVWLLTGPTFQFFPIPGSYHQYGTTIVTFPDVFLIQNTQNRDAISDASKTR